jgi:pimeloyl-ACP methyl ester carboxylesterase
VPTRIIEPRYITLPGGQIRLWRTGSGPDLVALSGLTLAASVSARLLAEALPERRITVIELPGIGGSSEHEARDLGAIAAALDATLDACAIESFTLAAFDLAAAVATPLTARRRAVDRTLLFGADAASAWAARALAPPDIRPRQDGTHLTALWAFIRDCHLLQPDDPTQPAPTGEPLPDADDLDATVTAAAMRPERYAALWSACAAAIGDADGKRIALAEARDALSGSGLPAGTSTLPATEPRPAGQVWHQYVETARGRMHLRRAGGPSGRPTLVIPTGGGSSAQFEPVVTGLAQGGDRQVFAVDYLGNGLSDKPVRDVTIGTLAEDMAALLDALGFEEVDVWGSHTGALVGLELAVLHPARVRRAVLEGPVFISPDFQSDILSHYFPPIRPDKWGMHIQQIWNWRRDMFMYWPWYRVAREAARQLGVPRSEELHKYAIGILESGSTYDLAYRSAFTYDTAARLPLLKRPALVCAGPNDMLVSGLKDAERLAVPGVEVRLTPTTIWWPDPDPKLAAETLALYRAYLDAA